MTLHYPFPQDLTLKEVRDATNARNAAMSFRAFYEAEREDHVIFNYRLAIEAAFPPVEGPDARANAILRECRGLIFSKATGRVVARRFHKFFNVNERAETQAHAIDWSRPHTVLEKLDGSMLTPFRGDSGQRRWGTKLGVTPAAATGEAFADAHPRYSALADGCEAAGRTPMLEWISRGQRIVLDYAEDDLVLTGVRDLTTGAYLPLGEMQALGAEHGVTVVRALADPVADGRAFLDHVEHLVGAEGYVVRFDDGHMVKVKGAWYARIHKLKERLQLEKDVLELVLADQLDDLRPFMDDGDQRRVDAYAERLLRRLGETAARLGETVEAARARLAGDKKRFAIEVAGPWPTPIERPLLFLVWDGADPFIAARDLILKSSNTATRVDQVRPLFAPVTWEDYRDRSLEFDA